MQPSALLKATAATPVMELLRQRAQTRRDEIETWMQARRMESGAPFYSSVDLRHAGYKIAPVDTNLFPAGFNQLSAAARARAATRMQARLMRYHDLKRILLIPENHTRNTGYIDNLVALISILRAAGCEVELGSLIATDAPIEVRGSGGEILREMPLRREGSLLKAADAFCPQLILLNNDLTAGLPEQLRGVAQPIVPRPSLGWHRRRKSIYFEAYAKLAHEFAIAFDLDPWLISTEQHKCGQVNFGERQGLECVAVGVEKVLHKIRAHYTRYGIAEEPYVYVKSDSGTYGMGIMTVRSGDEVIEINKKARNKMNIIKEGVQSTEVIIQEGVPTLDTVGTAPAEPMLYLVDGYAVGGAYRVNDARDAQNNLNAAGMRFVGMCDEGEAGTVAMSECEFGALGLIAELASLAAQREEYGESYSI
ncbi:MAG: glutamate--cysteine ligase [Alphaproteobacteria bacterium]|nr:glutamate--cysteine ligase [Alphaproteobacteria bacterium]